MKKVKIVFIILFFCIIAVPLLTFTFQNESVSSVDNRELKRFPAGEDYEGDLANELKTYVDDRIGMREKLIQVYSKMNQTLYGEMIHPLYTYGEEGYVFAKLKRKKSAEDFIDKFVDYLTKMQVYCDERNVQFIFCVQPEKATVYQEYLPAGYNYSNESLDYLLAKLDEFNIHYVDNSALLREKAKEEQVFNVAYDANHWNDLGAFYGTNNILREINKTAPEITENQLSDFELVERVDKYLPTSNFKVNETNLYLDGKIELIEDETYADELKMGEVYKTYQMLLNREVDQNGPSLLMFQGSYLNGRYQFMGNQFKEYAAVHNYFNVENLEYYFNIFQPDYVVFEVAEYTLTTEYFDVDGMMDKTLNPGLESFDNLMAVEETDEIKVDPDTRGAIAELSIRLDGEEPDYAYIVIDDKVYDGWIDNEKRIINTSLPTDDLQYSQLTLVVVKGVQKHVYNNIKIQ